MNWDLTILFHLPHDRFALGWEYIGPDDQCNYTTLKFYILIMTLELNF